MHLSWLHNGRTFYRSWGTKQGTLHASNLSTIHPAHVLFSTLRPPTPPPPGRLTGRVCCTLTSTRSPLLSAPRYHHNHHHHHYHHHHHPLATHPPFAKWQPHAPAPPPPPLHPPPSPRPGEPRIAALKTADDVRALFQEVFPSFLPAVREVDLQRFAVKKDSSLPTFSYAGPVLHHGSTACLVGDAIHCVKPYFGQGVNSAFEDVAVLQKALDESGDDPKAAVQRYSELRSKDAEALVVLSHSLDGGFLTFVGPLILDSMLNRLLPKIFSPNIIASLQNEKWSFAQIRARKRVDRAMQVGLLAGLTLLLARVVVGLLGLASKVLAKGGVM